MARHLRELSGRRECSVLGEVVPLLMGLIVVVAAQSLLHAVSAHAGGSYAISILLGGAVFAILQRGLRSRPDGWQASKGKTGGQKRSS